MLEQKSAGTHFRGPTRHHYYYTHALDMRTSTSACHTGPLVDGKGGKRDSCGNGGLVYFSVGISKGHLSALRRRAGVCTPGSPSIKSLLADSLDPKNKRHYGFRCSGHREADSNDPSSLETQRCKSRGAMLFSSPSRSRLHPPPPPCSKFTFFGKPSSRPFRFKNQPHNQGRRTRTRGYLNGRRGGTRYLNGEVTAVNNLHSSKHLPVQAISNRVDHMPLQPT